MYVSWVCVALLVENGRVSVRVGLLEEEKKKAKEVEVEEKRRKFTQG